MQPSNCRNPANIGICHFPSHIDFVTVASIWRWRREWRSWFQFPPLPREAGWRGRALGTSFTCLMSTWFMYRTLPYLYLRSLICFPCCGYLDLPPRDIYGIMNLESVSLWWWWTVLILGPLLRLEEVRSWSRTTNEQMRTAFLSNTGTEAL